MEENPFPELSIDSTDFLNTISGRQKCKKCHRSRKYYCYTCYVPVPDIEDKVPVVKLPLKIDVIKHPSEVDGKSTAIHAAVIAPDDVTVYTYPCIPDYDDKDKVVLVFPGDTSMTLAELAKKLGFISEDRQNRCKRKHDDDLEYNNTRNENHNKVIKLNTEESADAVSIGKSHGLEESSESNGKGNIDSVILNEQPREPIDASVAQLKDTSSGINDTGSDNNSGKSESCLTVGSILNEPGSASSEARCVIERVIFIDSTWNQSKSIYNDERLKGLQCVELKTRETQFWRHQRDIPNTYLSTIEAIYYFLREFHEQFISNAYRGQYDNLLFFFKFMHGKIRTLYDGGKELKAYKEREHKETV